MTDNLKISNALTPLLFDLAELCETKHYNIFNVKKGSGYTHTKQNIYWATVQQHVFNTQPIAVFQAKGNNTRTAVIDVDNHAGVFTWDETTAAIIRVVEGLRTRGFRPLVLRSGGGNGIHIWLIWESSQSCKNVRVFLKNLLKEYGLKVGTAGIEQESVEIYPKQDSVSEGKIGNPIALPFSRKSLPLDDELQPISFDDYKVPHLHNLYSPPVPKIATHAPIAQENGQYFDTILAGDEEEVVKALNYVSADEYDTWIKIGLILKHCLPEVGFAIFDTWSQKSTKYQDHNKTFVVWEGFEPDGTIGIGSLFFLAQENGWNGPSDPSIREMNAKYGIVTQGNKTMIVEKMGRQDDDRPFSWISKEVLADRYRSERIEVPSGDRGTKLVSMVEYWFRNKRAAHYHRVDFDPSFPPGDNGKIWNIWTGFAVSANLGDWSLMQAHILDNICNGNVELNAWVLNWMALGVQKPGAVIGTAVVLYGLPGTGKGVLAHNYGSLWGKHYTTITHDAQVRGRFNAHIFGRRLIFVDEGMWGGNRQDAGTMKTRITEPYIMIEPKGIDAIRVRNRSIYMIASNEASIVPADLADRRWQMFEVGDKHREDHNYFAALTNQLENGGREAMLFDLLNRDISMGPDPRRTIKTAGLFEQILHAQGPEFRFIFQILDEGALPQPRAPGNGAGVTTIQAMYEEMRATQPKGQFVHIQYFGRQLNKLFPGIRTAQNGTFLKGQGAFAEHSRSTRYHFPALSICRQDFERHVGQQVPWSNELADWQFDDYYKGDEGDNCF